MLASLLSGLKPTLIIGGILLTLLLATGGAFYWYYSNSQTQIENLEKEATTANSAYNQQLASYNKLRADIELQKKLVSTLQEKLVSTTKEKEVLNTKLRKHDLQKLSDAKPGLIENIINKATKKFYDTLSAESAISGTTSE